MRRRRKVMVKKKKGPLRFKHVLGISFCIFLIMTVLSLYIVNGAIKPIIMDIANLETQKIATSTINYSLNNVVQNIDINDLIIFETDEEGAAVSVGFDSEMYNQILVEAIGNAQQYLEALETGHLQELDYPRETHGEAAEGEGIIHYIPLGAATNNAFLAHLGPNIPVKFTTIGDVDVDLNEEIVNVGINNVWMRVSIDLKVQVEVIIPFATEMDLVTTTIPVGMVLVPGEVPQFYGSGQGNMPIPAFIMEDED